jgi:serine protease Do
MPRISRWGIALACLALGIALGCFVSGSRSTGQNPPRPPEPAREMTSYREVVRRVLPAVVSLEGKSAAKKPEAPRKRPDNFDQLPREYQRFWEELERRREQMPSEESMGFGSGWIVDPSGIILTNYHVVDGVDQVEVTLVDGRKYTSKQIISDKKTDVAIIRIQPRSALPYLEFGDSDSMEIGDHVLALGAPFGLTGSVTSGIISAKGRNLRMNMNEDFLQTDAAINPGSSGGPLVNMEGKVIGITAAIKSRSGGFQGIGLAVTSNLAKQAMQQLLKDGVVRRGYMGVQIKDLDPDSALQMGLRETAVVIRKVFTKSPAANAGLNVGDVIISVAGRPVKNGGELARIVGGLPVSTTTDVLILRDGKYYTLKMTVADQPDDGG